jgi:hypothetical protein
MAGFKFRYRLSGAPPTVQVLKAKDTETLTEGDLLNLETGEVDLLATADTNALGVCLGPTGATVDSTTDIRFIRDADAVYGIEDANARVMGATLDVAGATGAQTVATSSNKNFVVVAPSSATEETLVRFNVGKHHDNVAL